MRRMLVPALAAFIGVSSGCGKKVEVQGPSIVERDRDLFDSSRRFLEKSRYESARIDLRVLMATYPDSEYAPQAKYAYAETFYREGGSSALASAEVEFRDYLTFFPETDLADDAQLMVAMTHIKQMEKPDRDDTHARLAEYELNKMIKDHPDSPLSDEAKEKLRAVQEVLAESIFGPAKQYFLRKSYPAVIDRCEEILKKYPDFSGTDRVLFELAESHRRMNDLETATTYFAKIIQEYPLSDKVKDAKKHLVELNSPIPDPDPLVLTRTREKQAQSGGGFLGWIFGSGPKVSTDTGAASIKGNSGELTIEKPQ